MKLSKHETLETHLLKKLLIDKGTITDQRQIANKFNGFFLIGIHSMQG